MRLIALLTIVAVATKVCTLLFKFHFIYILVRLWNLQTKKGVVDYRGHAYSVWDVAVNVAGTYFVSSSLDRTLRLWNTEYACPLRIYAGHNDSVDVSCFVYSWIVNFLWLGNGTLNMMLYYCI